MHILFIRKLQNSIKTVELHRDEFVFRFSWNVIDKRLDALPFYTRFVVKVQLGYIIVRSKA